MKLLIKLLTLIVLLATVSFHVAHAVAPKGKQVSPAITLQGGSDSNAKWLAPLTSAL